LDLLFGIDRCSPPESLNEPLVLCNNPKEVAKLRVRQTFLMQILSEGDLCTIDSSSLIIAAKGGKGLGVPPVFGIVKLVVHDVHVAYAIYVD
jgi:hypothetical protein